MIDVELGYQPFSRLSRPSEAIRQFTPNWFAVTMGTGILAIALAQVPWQTPVLKTVAESLWFANMGLFALFVGLYLLRWIFYFDGARRIFGHSVVSMFFGCIPMSLATIINGFVFFGVAHWGDTAIRIAETLWWVDLAMAFVCGTVIPFMMFTRQQHSIDQMTAVWLLPVVAAEVAAVSGAIVAPHVAAPHGQLLIVILSYVAWALSVPLALSILVILVLRMAIHKLPPSNLAATSWLTLGPIGTGALGMLNLAAVAPKILSEHGILGAASVIQGLGQILGLLLWGHGLWWMIMATLITWRYLHERIPFNLGWWGYTFPLGVFSLATLRLESVYSVGFFGALGSVFVFALVVLWTVIFALTVRGAWRGELFIAPCLCEKR